MRIRLTSDEVEVLFRQDPSTKNDGGYQSLLIDLQRCCNRDSGELELTEKHLERIPKYAFNHGNGGWETRLKSIFARTLGNNLTLG